MARGEPFDLVVVDIDAKHFVANFCEAGSSGQADEAGAKNGYFHAGCFLLIWAKRRLAQAATGGQCNAEG